MYQTISKSMFHDAFRNYDRLENFSYEAREALFEHLEASEESSGNQIELDVIALCCDYNEDYMCNVFKDYDIESLEELEEQTMVLWHDEEKVLYVAF